MPVNQVGSGSEAGGTADLSRSRLILCACIGNYSHTSIDITDEGVGAGLDGERSTIADGLIHLISKDA